MAEDGNFVRLPELPEVLQLQEIHSRIFPEATGKKSRTELTRALPDHPSLYKLD